MGRRVLFTGASALCLPVAVFAQAAPTGAPTVQPAVQPGAAYSDLLDRAHAAREVGDHQTTLDLLRAAEHLRPSVVLQWAVAFEALQLGDTVTARQEATQCVLEAATAGLQATVTPEVHTAGAQCAAILGRVQGEREDAPGPAGRTSTRSVDPGVGRPVRPVRPVRSVPAGTAGTSQGGGPGIVSVALLSAGAVGLALAAVFYGLRASVLAPCDVTGNTASCPASDLDRARQAPTWALTGQVTMAVGLAAVAGGAVTWALTPRTEPASVTLAMTPGGLTVGGRF